MMHVVLGDGEMTKRELSSTLEDLLESAGDEPFWFLVQAKPEPTATDEALLGWLVEKEIYFEIIGDDLKGADKIYAQAQEKHEVKRLAPKTLSLMQEKPEEGEEANLLALFVSNDSDAEEDRWLNEIVQSVIEAGFTVKALNDGLTEVGLDEAVEGEAEEAEEVEADGGVKDYTREQLEEMELDEVKAVAAERGITLPPRTRKATYVDHLLGEAEEPPEAEVTETPSTNGDATASSLDEWADALVDAVIRKLASVLN